MLKTVAIADLKPNPYRRLDEYEIIREKVETLKQSIESTGFWGTIVGRASGRFIEIAFGHHRLVALREGKDKTVEIIVRDLTNEQMLKMMANENLEEWGHSAMVEIETIEATLEAAGKGEVTLPPIPRHTKPDYIKRLRQGDDAVVYTASSVAEFLGWTRDDKGGIRPNLACEMAFAAIDAIKKGFLKRADLKGLKRNEVWLLVKGQEKIHEVHAKVAERFTKDAEDDFKRAEKARSPMEKERFQERAQINAKQSEYHRQAAETKAKEFARYGSEKIRGGGGTDAVEGEARVWTMTAPVERPVHDVDDLANKIARQLENFANGKDAVSKDFDFLRGVQNDLSDHAADGLRQSFAALVGRLKRMQSDLADSTSSHFVGTSTGHSPKAIANGRKED